MRIPVLLLLLLAAGTPAAARAESLTRITDRATFLADVAEHELSLLAVRIRATRDGLISGRAFGKPVSGRWYWSGMDFCSTLVHGGQTVSQGCQPVYRSPRRVHFASSPDIAREAFFTLH